MTESGFGSDMGMEKFFDIVCRQAGSRPRPSWSWRPSALRLHGGGQFPAPADLSLTESIAQVERGAVNLVQHVENVREFGIHASSP